MRRPSLPLSGFLFSAVLFGVTATFAHAAEGEAYVLAKQNFMPPAGTVLTRDFTMGMKDAAMKIEAGGQEFGGTMTRKETSQETMEALTVTKIRSVLLKKEVGGVVTVNGQDQDNPEKPDALLETPVILELKDGKWSATLENGAEPTAEQKESLEKKVKSANVDSDFETYGATPRKVGDEWKVDPSKTNFSNEMDLKGDYSVKFVEVKEIAGVKCAVLKATYDFKGKVNDQPGGESPEISMKGESVSIRSIADMTDVDVTIKATMKLEGSPQEGVTMHVAGTTEGTQKVKIKKP